MTSVPVIFPGDEQILPWCRLSLVLGFGVTQNFLVRTGTQDGFWWCGVCYYNYIFETKDYSFRLSSVELQKPSLLNSRSFFGVVVFVSVISLSKQMTCYSSVVFSFRGTGKVLCSNRTQVTFSGDLTFVWSFPGLKKQECQVWYKPVFSSRAVSEQTYKALKG